MGAQMQLFRRGTIARIDTPQKLVGLALLVLEVVLLAIIARSSTVTWWMVLIGIFPLVLVIYGVFFGPQARARVGNPNLARNVVLLRQRLHSENFTPDLIAGLARGGVVVAARLSHDLGLTPPTPIVSFWPHSEQHFVEFNSVNLPMMYEAQRSVFSEGHLWRILVVDDAAKSGRSLKMVKDFIEHMIRDIPHDIRTAALEITRGEINYDPTYHVVAKVPRDAWDNQEP